MKIDKYDKTFSDFIRLRDKCCQRCGSVYNLECSHIMSRRHIATRYDDKNAKALCKICHIWWHANPVDAIEWVKLIIGSENYNALRIKANTICKITRDNKELIRRDLIERIKLMETSEEECWLDINGHITKRC